MADTDEDVLIELEDDKAEQAGGDITVEAVDAGAGEKAPPEVVKADETVAKPVDPEEGIRKLKADLAAEQAARAAAEQRAQQAEHGIAQARNEVQDTNLNLVNNAIERVKQTVDVLKANYAAAAAAGDFATMAEIQADMSSNMVDLKQLEMGKVQLENAPKQQPRQIPPTDPVEVLASQLSPRSAAWVRSHPEYARDQRLYQRMLGAHNLTITDNIPEDSDAYFERVETLLGLRDHPLPGERPVAPESPLSEAAGGQGRQGAPPAAPVTRGNGTGNGSKPTTIRLTAAEREIAAMNGMTDQEYAKQKAALIREGKLN